MALLDFTNIIAKSFEDKKIVIGIFLDLTKAFDCISHQILLQKLQKILWYSGFCIKVVFQLFK